MGKALRWPIPELLSMNTIPQDQLGERQLDMLAAQRQMYSFAKSIAAAQMVATVPAVIVWAFLAAVLPGLKPYSALWALVAIILDIVVLSRWQKSIKFTAAKIQEMFDCDVLHMEWQTVKYGEAIDDETISSWATRYAKRDPGCSLVRDWYAADVAKLPLALARLACQKSNCWWDSNLRVRYAWVVGSVIGLLLLVVVLISMIGQFTVNKLVLAAIVPWLPALALGLRQILDNVDAAKSLNRLKAQADALWSKAIDGNVTDSQLAAESRMLQNEIFDSRKLSPLIPDFIYGRLRREYEEQMNISTAKLVEQALRRMSGRT